MLNFANKFFGLFGFILLDNNTGRKIYYENIALKSKNESLRAKLEYLVHPVFAKFAANEEAQKVIESFSVNGDLNNLKRALKDRINSIDYKVYSKVSS